MFIKFSTWEEAEEVRKATQSLVSKYIIVCPPIPVWDGTFAIEKLTDNDFGGEVVESTEPPQNNE